MFETTTDPRTRDAFRTAHEARGQALADAIHWLFRKSSR